MSELLELTVEQGEQLLLAAGIFILYLEWAQIENLHRAGRAINAGETPADGQP